MKLPIFRLLPLLLLTACNRVQQKQGEQKSSNPNIDYALRDLLGVQTMLGLYEVPQGYNAYLLTVLEYKEGKLIGRGLKLSGEVEELENRTLKAQMLWHSHDDQPKVLVKTATSLSFTGGRFWYFLNFSYGFKSADIHGHGDPYDGYTILAFVESSPENSPNSFSGDFAADFTEAVKVQKSVGALAVMPFRTFEEAEKERLRTD